jgi:error-prone DNA polymerase
MYAELAAATNFSFLRGASQPADMVEAALALGHKGIGIADRNSVAGVVRAWRRLRDLREQGLGTDFRLLTGARLVFADETPEMIVYPTTRRGWGRLTRMLSAGNLRVEKGSCALHFNDLLEWAEDWAVILSPPLQGRGRGWGLLSDRAVDSPHPNPVAPNGPSGEPSSWPTPDGEGLHHPLAILRNRIPLLWLGATMHRAGRDHRQLAELKALSAETGIPLIAINDALYATPDARPLHDIMTCIREGTTVDKAGRLLAANAERHLKPPAEMVRLFSDCPEAIGEIARLMDSVNFGLDQLAYDYPHEPVPPGYTPQGWLETLVARKAAKRWPDGLPDGLQALLDNELAIIGRLKFAAYFLTVHDVVRFANKSGILCQGRGSAANSAVCYVLGITAVDPVKHSLLFSRFISEKRAEPPDIDVDFEHERREEVMQYVYRRYGRHRAGIVATVIHYRPRSAVREVGKALGLTEDVTARLAGTVWGSWGSAPDDKRLREAGFEPDNPEIARLRALAAQILTFPRHLSQHVGGFVLTEDRLDETVPIHNAAMEDRTFIEWDKDDIDALGLMKVDVLALGMLTCIRKAFDMIEGLKLSPLQGGGLGGGTVQQRHDRTAPSPNPVVPNGSSGGRSSWPTPEGEDGKLTLQSVPDDDPAVFDMLCRADTIGVFQVESRAQMSMLPRLQPRCFYDIAIQVAIVRPGPIQGNMVHPYLRRRDRMRRGQIDFAFPSPAPPHDPDELKGVLGKTLGVPLFQEQAMKLAIVAAEFSDAEANELRRAMATFRNVGTIHKFQTKLVEGMVERGYERDFAERCYEQIKGFGSYGFPESHAIAFARLAWISSWLKHHHPAVFAAALLNAQPMGFYAPAQIVRDAREHGVEVLPVDVNASGWDNDVTKPLPFRGGGRGGVCPPARFSQLPHPNPSPEGEGLMLRLGFRQIGGFREEWAETIVRNRPFASVEELIQRGGVPRRALDLLADADALRSLGVDRRDGAWDIRRAPPRQLPLFAAAEAPELAPEPAMRLPAMQLGDHVAADYQTVRLSLKAHPMHILRPVFEGQCISDCAGISARRNGARAKVAGIVLVRQRPGKGNAIFVTLEDETGVTNVIMWARTFERFRLAVMSARLMEVHGEVQKSPEGVVHLMAHRVIDRSAELGRLSGTSRTDPQLSRADEVAHPVYPRHGHPRDVRTFPKSRDFH